MINLLLTSLSNTLRETIKKRYVEHIMKNKQGKGKKSKAVPGIHIGKLDELTKIIFFREFQYFINQYGIDPITTFERDVTVEITEHANFYDLLYLQRNN